MASQTGSIDLTASNSVKLAAEAGWQSDLDEYYKKSEIDLTVEGINADVTEIVDGLTQSSHFTQTATGFEFTLDDALADAEKTATNYIGIDSTGIRIANANPNTTTTYQHQSATSTEFVVDGNSMAEISGNGARFGVNAAPHLELSSSRMILTELNDSLNSRPRFDVNARDTYYSDPFDIPSSALSTGLTVKIAGGFVKVTPAALSIGDSSRTDESDATLLAGTSMVRVGKAASDRVTVDPTNGITIYKGNSKRLQTTANGIDVYGSDGTTSIASFGSTVTLGNAASGSVVTIDPDSMDMVHGTTEMLHFGYGEGAAASGTAVAPYYTIGTRAANSTVGNYSVAEGYGTVASGYCSHAEGRGTTASGKYSHAEGHNITVNTYYSHAEGHNTTASGQYSHAEGYSTTITEGGLFSHAQNYGTIAASESQTAMGMFNVKDASNTYLLIIGNGTSNSARSNALTVDWDGNVTHGVDMPWTNLQLASSVEPYSDGQTPRYRKWGPVVQVLGAVKLKSNQSAGFNVSIGTLPSECRPLTQVATVCQGSGNDTWLCNVSAGGVMNIERYRNGGTNAAATTSTWLPFSITFLTA